ncbi:hypothetical protein RBH29_08870 [Herbivorax sp. ANBcel31]|nr:hypothetical protein [Herbivorax sp. ANBcel31]MDQ2086535.1 hypothetical protein [Herbivorax sp. ANBcel31]
MSKIRTFFEWLVSLSLSNTPPCIRQSSSYKSSGGVEPPPEA